MKVRGEWIQQPDAPVPGGKFGAGLLSAFAWIYGQSAALHRAWYARGPGRPTRLPCKVISIGNLTVGGTGKTPVAAWVASRLRERGHRVAIASRGYGGSVGDDVHVVSDGRHVHGRFEFSGDEPMWLAARAPGVPVLVGRRRDRVGWRAIAAFDTHILVLDDGFQHHRLERDIDLVTFHGDVGLGGGAVLPRGPLRERIDALASADGIIVVEGPLGADDEARIREAAPGAEWFAAERTAEHLRPLAGGEPLACAELEGRSVGVLTGIARPAAVRATVEGLGASVVAERGFPDHHVFRPQDLADLDEDAAFWVITEKDAGKIPPGWLAESSAEIYVLVLQTGIAGGDAFVDWLEASLRARPGGRDSSIVT